MEEIIENEDNITQFALVELNDVIIEGERGEEILECEGDWEDQTEVMFEEEELCFGFIAKEFYIFDYFNYYFFFEKEQLTLDTVLSDLIGVERWDF